MGTLAAACLPCQPPNRTGCVGIVRLGYSVQMRLNRWVWPATMALATLASSCAPARDLGESAIAGFVEAVQTEDIDTLYCTLTGASEADADTRRVDFEAWARARYDVYEQGRDEGWVDFGEDGIPLIKALTLGRGTFYSIDSAISAGEATLVVETEVRLAYAHVDLSRLAPGTTFYVCGVPIGRIHSVIVPTESREIALDLLETVRLEWTLIRRPANEDCPQSWTVASVKSVEGSVSMSEITWLF